VEKQKMGSKEKAAKYTKKYFQYYAKSVHLFMDLDKAVGYYQLEKFLEKVLEQESKEISNGNDKNKKI